MLHTTARETASNARLESLPLLANGFAIRVWLESRTLETVALNATLASLGLEWVPAKYVQLDMHSLKTARHFVFLAFQERIRAKRERHHVNNAQKMKKAKTPVRRSVMLAEKVKSPNLAVLNVQNATQEKQEHRVNHVKKGNIVMLPCLPSCV
jgi:hypothetical protein